LEDKALDWVSTARTDVGKVRDHNEDAMLDRPDLGVWVVADGMGGHSAGDLASGMIVDRLGAIDPPEDLSQLIDTAENIVIEVNTELRKIARERDAHMIGSTIVSLLAVDEYAVCMWAGDSRLYRLRSGKLIQVSTDHALVAELLERGVITEEQAVNHPQGNLVTRAVGASDTLHLDLEIIRLRPGDRLLLCSDGLDKEVSDDEIQQAMRDMPDGGFANSLVELALERGSRDNVTVIGVEISGLPEIDDTDDSEDTIQVPADKDETVPGFTTGSGTN
jgi:protein phosphatase